MAYWGQTLKFPRSKCKLISNELGSLQLWRVHIQPATIHYLDPTKIQGVWTCRTAAHLQAVWQGAVELNKQLGGGYSGGFKCFWFLPLPGEMIQFEKYRSNGLKPPTRQLPKVLFPPVFLGGWFLSLIPLKYAKLLVVQCQLCQMILTHKLWIFMNHSWFLVHVEVLRFVLHTNQKDRFQPHEPSNGDFVFSHYYLMIYNRELWWSVVIILNKNVSGGDSFWWLFCMMVREDTHTDIYIYLYIAYSISIYIHYLYIYLYLYKYLCVYIYIYIFILLSYMWQLLTLVLFWYATPGCVSPVFFRMALETFQPGSPWEGVMRYSWYSLADWIMGV